MSKLINAIKKEEQTVGNKTRTENGAVTLKSTLSGVLDFFALGAALRTRTDEDVISIFQKAYNEDPLLALKALFYIRDVRGGQGERSTFRKLLTWLAKTDKDVVLKNLKVISEFGRWDDIFVLVGTPLEDKALKLIETQYKEDLKLMKTGESISLLGKWMPSINTSSASTVLLAKKLCKYLEIDYKTYRKNLSALRSHVNIVEKNLCTKNYSDIDYEKIPSKAGMLYRKAFARNDNINYSSYLNAVKKGTAKINTATLYPHEIVHTIFNEYNKNQDLTTLELLWKNLPDYSGGVSRNVIPLVDVSGSMDSVAAGNATAMSISIALGMYFAERINGMFKNHLITFDSTPKLVEIQGSTLIQKLLNIKQQPWGMSTNLQAAFDLILNFAVKNKLSQSDLPDELIIVSDMEFNQCIENSRSNHDVMRIKFKNAGYEVPHVTFWNVNARGTHVPVSKHASGVKLVSGFSPSILKSILTSKEVTPYDFMVEVLSNERYDVVKI